MLPLLLSARGEGQGLKRSLFSDPPAPDAHPAAAGRTYNMKSGLYTPLRRLDEVWIQSPVFFITVCTAQREKWLLQEEAVSVLMEEWGKAETQHGWRIGRYVIMPDHVHFFTAQNRPDRELSSFIKLWKEWTAKGCRRRGLQIGGWQRGFFDHVLRSSESFEEKWIYVWQNPVRAGLVSDAKDWRYQGEIFPL
jgi:putative transposase